MVGCASKKFLHQELPAHVRRARTHPSRHGKERWCQIHQLVNVFGPTGLTRLLLSLLRLCTRQCGRPLDVLRLQRAACATWDVLGKSGFPTEGAAARTCWKAGAPAKTNESVADMDITKCKRFGSRRLELFADGLLHGGAQSAIDTVSGRR